MQPPARPADEDVPAPPISVRRSSQKGSGYGWTINIPPDWSEGEISQYINRIEFADGKLRDKFKPE